jgi:hypothetical protein
MSPLLHVGLQIPLVPYQWCVMYFPQNIILDFGIRDKIDHVSVVDDVIHYPVLVILNTTLHYLTSEGILGVFHQNNGLPVS